MHEGLVTPIALRSLLYDGIALTKPRITLLSVGTAATGMVLAPPNPAAWGSVSLLGIAMVVAAANVLNMHAEIPFDALMPRTCQRPLPAGRWESSWAWTLGWGLVLGACFFLVAFANFLTLCVGLAAFALYLFAYTPLKRKSSLALFVGAVAGSAPPVMGYTAVCGQIDVVACILFSIVFIWQIPHFLAISMLRQREYRQAGFVVFSEVFGRRISKWTLVVTAMVLCCVSLLLWREGACGALYATVAVLVGCWFIFLCMRGFFCLSDRQWARHVFYASLIYPMVLFAGVWADKFVHFS
ncbi:MAG: heme o synthase [Myxococcota bacterium]